MMCPPDGQPDVPPLPVPRLLAWELTRRCVLKCRHCRASAGEAVARGDELTTAQIVAGLVSAAGLSSQAGAGPLTVILTGGEPLLRADVYEIAAAATAMGLRVVLATCGVLLDADVCRRLTDAGVRRVSVSLDGPDPTSHDRFRSQAGCFDAALRGIAAAREAGLAFQINSTLTRESLPQLPRMLELAVSLGARAFNPFMLVPTGRAATIADLEPSARQYEQALGWLADQQDRTDIAIRVTCAPQYQRVLRQRGDRRFSRRWPGRADQQTAAWRGCMAGESFAFVSHAGILQPCGFLPIDCGDLRAMDMHFASAWRASTVLAALRDPLRLRGKCSLCEYVTDCGGCRARAFAHSGDPLGPEPYCLHQPRADRPGLVAMEGALAGDGGIGAAGDSLGDGGGSAGAAAIDSAGAVRIDRDLDDLDRRLLTAVQSEFPVDPHPMALLAQRVGTSAQDVLERLGEYRQRGLIRRIGGVFDPARLGFVSTLAAAAVPEEQLEQAARVVCELPGVTHCYQRSHDVNLWFTLTQPSATTLEDTLAELSRRLGVEVRSFPSQRVYKLSTQFALDALTATASQGSALGLLPVARADDSHGTMSSLPGTLMPPVAIPSTPAPSTPAPSTSTPSPATPPSSAATGKAPCMGGARAPQGRSSVAQGDRREPWEDGRRVTQSPAGATVMGDADRALGRLVQGDLPLCDQPFVEVARRLGVTQEWVLERLRDWLSSGVLRRVSAAARHRSLGFVANAMAVFEVEVGGLRGPFPQANPYAQVDRAGAELAVRADVSHCYRRCSGESWPYNLYAMFHGRDAAVLRASIRQCANELHVQRYAILESIREFKKTSMECF